MDNAGYFLTRTGKYSIAITVPYWMGIVADALWSAALFSPWLFSKMAGIADFSPDLDFRLVMAIGGILMSGWTCLLLWAVREPVERRFVILLTAIPVVSGMFVVALIQVLLGNTFQIWILVKTSILFVSMIGSYLLARKAASVS